MGGCYSEFVRDDDEKMKMQQMRIVIKRLDRGFIKNF